MLRYFRDFGQLLIDGVGEYQQYVWRQSNREVKRKSEELTKATFAKPLG